MLIAHYHPVAAGRVRVEHTAGVHGEVGGLLYRRRREIFGRMNHDTPLAAHPGDDGRPVLVIVAPPGLAFLATTPWLAAQRFRPAFLGLSLLSGRVIEIIGSDRPSQRTTALSVSSRRFSSLTTTTLTG